jgi:hypothetical protein
MSIRSIGSLPLAPNTIETLLKSGFRSLHDIVDISAVELAKECSFPLSLASLIISQAKEQSNLPRGDEDLLHEQQSLSKKETKQLLSQEDQHLTAKEILTQIGIQKPIITFCREIDKMIGGGIPIGQITEICGVPGVSHFKFVTESNFLIFISFYFHSPAYNSSLGR